MNQKSMLQEMGDQTQAVSYRARLAREFIAQYPDVRPLPVGTDVVGTLLEEAGFEAALLVALRLREGAESDAALDQVLDQWPTDFRAHAAVTVGFVRLGRFDEAVRSMVDEFQSYFEKDRPIDRILLCGWGTHLARCLYKMGWDRYLVVQKESLRISSGRPQLGLNLLRDALSLAEGTEEALQFRDRILGAYQTTYLLQRSDLARESKQLHFPEDTSAPPARLNSGVVDANRLKELRAQLNQTPAVLPADVPVMGPKRAVRSKKEADYLLQMTRHTEVFFTVLDQREYKALIFRKPRTTAILTGPPGLVWQIFDLRDAHYAGPLLGEGGKTELDPRELTELASWTVEQEELPQEIYELASAALAEARLLVPEGQAQIPLQAFSDPIVGQQELQKSPNRYLRATFADWDVALLKLSAGGVLPPSSEALQRHQVAHRGFLEKYGALPPHRWRAIAEGEEQVIHSPQNPLRARTAREAAFILATDGFQIEESYQNRSWFSAIVVAGEGAEKKRVHFCFELFHPGWSGAGLGPGESSRLSDSRLLRLFGARVNVWEQSADDLQLALDGLLELEERAEAKGYHQGLSRESLQTMVGLMRKRVEFAKTDPARISQRSATASAFYQLGHRLWRVDTGPTGNRAFEYSAKSGWLEPFTPEAEDKNPLLSEHLETLTPGEFDAAVAERRREFGGMAPCSF